MTPEVIVAVMLVVGAGGLAAQKFRKSRAQRRESKAARAAEARLKAVVEGSGDAAEVLATMDLWVIVNRDAPGVPLALVLRGPESLALGESEGGHPAPRVVESVPRITCFSSRWALEQYAGTFLGALQARNCDFALMPAREVFGHATARGIEVWLNPDGAISRQFTVEELRQIIHE